MSQLRAKLAPFVANYSEAKFNKVLLGAFSCSVGYYQTQRTLVHAKTPLPTPAVVVKPREVEGFSWSRLWGFIKRYVFYLGFGIAMAMSSAYFNIQVPLCLGSITNVLTEVIKRDSSISMRQYWELMRRPAFKFATYIAAQAVTTALTISSIAKVGENLAQDLRKELFARMLAQDLTFFETHKSGDLIKRINDDVQTFKSDFKKLVGQGVKQGRVSA